MRTGIAVTSVLMAIVLAGAAATLGARARHRTPERSPLLRLAPSGTRVRVEVLNATRTRGLARRAMLQLRDAGFDVVALGNVAGVRDSTVVLDRSGHPEWARRVASAMGRAGVEERPDSSRYLDITVVLGTSWRAPAEPFYP
ncbi:MAG TPA: LytR C-terminal domain-containing protein [Gemmatimonadaceae bacterium]|nr:LytR C-terminal domain-containing protein [Gemmatimonadaceae bacterium]